MFVEGLITLSAAILCIISGLCMTWLSCWDWAWTLGSCIACSYCFICSLICKASHLSESCEKCGWSQVLSWNSCQGCSRTARIQYHTHTVLDSRGARHPPGIAFVLHSEVIDMRASCHGREKISLLALMDMLWSLWCNDSPMHALDLQLQEIHSLKSVNMHVIFTKPDCKHSKSGLGYV